MKPEEAHWQLFLEGDDYYKALQADILSASHFVFLEVYILDNDEIGSGILDALTKRAAEGLHVRLIADGFGSHGLSAQTLDHLRSSGVQFQFFRPLSLFGLLSPRSRRRSHRKLAVIDGKVCYIGGMNISRNQSQSVVGAKSWRDCTVRLEGHVAHDAGASFNRIWRYIKGRHMFFPRHSAGPSGRYEIVENTPRFKRRFRKVYADFVRSARQRVWISSAYFIPSILFLRRLTERARHGVDVRVLVSKKSDVPAARWASRAVYGPLLKRGVRIFEHQSRFIHSKSLVVDSDVALVGSANLDRRSFLHDLELSVICRQPDLNAHLARAFLADIGGAGEVTLADWKRRPWLARLLEWFFFLFRYYL